MKESKVNSNPPGDMGTAVFSDNPAEQIRISEASFSSSPSRSSAYIRTTSPVLMPRDYDNDSFVYARASDLRKARSLLMNVSDRYISLHEIILAIGTTALGVVLSNVSWDGEASEVVPDLIDSLSSIPGLITVAALITAFFIKKNKVRAESDLASRVLEYIKDPDDCVSEACDEH